ncbi:hypothetical protein MSIMFB_04500 [Mycobacterium simulans]|uniref:Uncharacterized protein n=1 Tax=Mycobacterium simulans TaxID=627089 RepID=A0A7Z7NCG9_9MYCO|nr:hypothetical protein [Mycobacterium simulans]SOJ57022.1 hypothetical protein MSIMFB_04500 [Mycobacterium simulans]
MSPAASRLRTSAEVIAGALVAEVVVYLGVLLAYSSAGEQPAQQVRAGTTLLAPRRGACFRHPSTVLPQYFPIPKEDRMICQTPNDDPCSRVTSPAEAVEYAEALLTSSAKPGCEFWAAGAVGPLAGMLYAASPRGNNEGIGWLTRVAAATTPEALADTAQGWRSAIPYLTDQPILGNALQRVLELDARQRDSVVMTMRDALAPWIHTESRDERE